MNPVPSERALTCQFLQAGLLNETALQFLGPSLKGRFIQIMWVITKNFKNEDLA